MLKLAGARDLLEAIDAQIRLPEVFFAFPADESPEINTEGNVSRCFEVESRERDGHDRGPAALIDFSARTPDAIPIRIVYPALICDQRISLCTQGVDREFVAAAPIMIRRDENGEVIVDTQIRIAPEFSGDDASGFAVIAGDQEIEGVLVIEHSHRSPFCCL